MTHMNHKGNPKGIRSKKPTTSRAQKFRDDLITQVTEGVAKALREVFESIDADNEERKKAVTTTDRIFVSKQAVVGFRVGVTIAGHDYRLQFQATPDVEDDFDDDDEDDFDDDDDETEDEDPTPLAQQLHEYIKFRASKEGVGYSLSAQFFEKGLRKGVRSFFGAECDDETILGDYQFPQYFDEWQQTQADNARMLN